MCTQQELKNVHLIIPVKLTFNETVIQFVCVNKLTRFKNDLYKSEQCDMILMHNYYFN